jgi:hypothetical protein
MKPPDHMNAQSAALDDEDASSQSSCSVVAPVRKDS